MHNLNMKRNTRNCVHKKTECEHKHKVHKNLLKIVQIIDKQIDKFSERTSKNLSDIS